MKERVNRRLPGFLSPMPSTQFHCAICGTGLSVEMTALGRFAECPKCRHVVPVPARLPGPPGSVDSLPVLPPGILALELKFLCPQCSAKLRIDARLEGQPVACPKCSHQILIPNWSTSPPSRIQLPKSHTAELSEAEIEFLSSPQEMKNAQVATG